MTNRVKCNQCDNMILEQTAQDNGGLCAPCHKRDKPSSSPYALQLKIPASELDDKQKRDQLEGAFYWKNETRIDELISGCTSFLSDPPSEFHTWLGEAISHGCNIAILEKLVVAGCDSNSCVKSPDQTTPLEVAINNERLDAIEWILGKGANPNVGRPIVSAINSRIPTESQIQILTLLLNAGADLKRSFALYGDERQRFTVLDWALLYKSSPDVVEFLKNNGAKTLAEIAM